MKSIGTKILCAIIFAPCVGFFVFKALVGFTNQHLSPVQGLGEAGLNVLLAIFSGAMWWSFVRKEDPKN